MSQSSGPLLEVDNLTVRFGGLTAVGDVNIRVEPGQVFAVIGPNGAGKTTLFNTITGLYAPTSGTVRFDGRVLERPFRPSLFARWASIGVAVGLLFLLFTADVDRLWLSAVKSNYRGVGEFSLTAAWGSFWESLSGEPRVEVRAGRFFVVSNDGAKYFGSSGTWAEAEQRRIELRESDELKNDRTRHQRRRTFAFFIGTLIGVFGAYVVWKQGRRAPAWIAGAGIARTFQNIRLFQQMTVIENVLVGMNHRIEEERPWWSKSQIGKYAAPASIAAFVFAASLLRRWEVLGPTGSGFLLLLGAIAAGAYLWRIGRLGAFSALDVAVETHARSEAMKLLDFVGLKSRAEQEAKSLPYGDQRRLEIARALATRPKLLLLDEPAAGMNPSEAASLVHLIRQIRDRGHTVLLIEHHMRVVMGISDRIAVLVYGRKIAEGTPDEIKSEPKVIEAYLGKEDVG